MIRKDNGDNSIDNVYSYVTSFKNNFTAFALHIIALQIYSRLGFFLQNKTTVWNLPIFAFVQKQIATRNESCDW